MPFTFLHNLIAKLGMAPTESTQSATEPTIDFQNEYKKNKSVFGAILRGESPASFLYQDDQCVAFYDIEPIAPVHFLVIPRKHIRSFSNATEDDEQLLGHLLVVANKVARQLNLNKGYRLVVNSGEHARQTVFHLHIHVLGGRFLSYCYA